MDAPNYGQSYTDPEVMAAMEKDGADLAAELIGDAEIDNSVFEGISGVTRAIHICRGNGPGGSWSATGGYDRFAPQAFPRLSNYDALLLEYDTPRSGDFSPLQHVLPSATGRPRPADHQGRRTRRRRADRAAHPRGVEVRAAGAPDAEHAVRLRLRRRRQPPQRRAAVRQAPPRRRGGEEGLGLASGSRNRAQLDLRDPART